MLDRQRLCVGHMRVCLCVSVSISVRVHDRMCVWSVHVLWKEARMHDRLMAFVPH